MLVMYGSPSFKQRIQCQVKDCKFFENKDHCCDLDSIQVKPRSDGDCAQDGSTLTMCGSFERRA